MKETFKIISGVQWQRWWEKEKQGKVTFSWVFLENHDRDSQENYLKFSCNFSRKSLNKYEKILSFLHLPPFTAFSVWTIGPLQSWPGFCLKQYSTLTFGASSPLCSIELVVSWDALENCRDGAFPQSLTNTSDLQQPKLGLRTRGLWSCLMFLLWSTYPCPFHVRKVDDQFRQWQEHCFLHLEERKFLPLNNEEMSMISLNAS